MKFGRPLACGLALSFPLQSVGVSAGAVVPVEELADDLLHADAPLWGTGSKDLFPRHFSNPAGDFGCINRIALGNWRFQGESLEYEWWRLENYGVFHCAIVERRADELDGLKHEAARYSFIVKIGELRRDGAPLELWTLQSGTRPGSDYTLLARKPNDGIIRSFTILQRRCPAGKVRHGPSLDIWQTRYCAINTKAEILALAQQMAKIKPLGMLEWIGDGAPTDTAVSAAKTP